VGKPLVLHEQNSVAGMANKVLAGVADRVFTAFPNVLKKGAVGGQPAAPAFCAERPGRAFCRAAAARCACWWWAAAWARKALNDIVPQALALMPADQRPMVCTKAAPTQIDELRANYARPPACRPTDALH
jgi:UDP-N-acetylglucosamine--N-acetylmuramyl-(pentapeptide) pyrophosphoryl-undecaprenol N-acetylglucosamine transferase